MSNGKDTLPLCLTESTVKNTMALLLHTEQVINDVLVKA